MFNNALCFSLYFPFVYLVFFYVNDGSGQLFRNNGNPGNIKTFELEKNPKYIYCVRVIVHFIGFILI